MNKLFSTKKHITIYFMACTLLLSACQFNKVAEPTKAIETAGTESTQPKSKLAQQSTPEASSKNINLQSELADYLSKSAEHLVTLDNKSGKLAIPVQKLKVKIMLPKSWQIKKEKAKMPLNLYDLALDGTGRHEVYDDKNNLTLAFSYMPYEDYPGEENNLQAIYNTVALGNHYHFIVRKEDEHGGDKLAILEDTDDKQVVFCMHYSYASENGKPGKEQLRPGALVRFKKEHLFIAIYGDEKLDENLLKSLALSIKQA